MTDESAQQLASKRVRRPTDRARVADERGRPIPRVGVAAKLAEADQIISVLRELHLILMSARPDRRSIAYAAASLRGELPAERSEQAALFSLHVRALTHVRAEWVDDEDARVKQALSYLACPRLSVPPSSPSARRPLLRRSWSNAGRANANVVMLVRNFAMPTPPAGRKQSSKGQGHAPTPRPPSDSR